MISKTSSEFMDFEELLEINKEWALSAFLHLTRLQLNETHPNFINTSST